MKKFGEKAIVLEEHYQGRRRWTC